MTSEQNLHDCDVGLIDGYLSESLDQHDERALEEHLDSCDDCRQKMQVLAADHDTWDHVECYLKDEANDSISLSSDCELIPTAATSSVQINSVLGVMTPTDDPDMLGRLGSYEVSGVIGSGGMGVVLKAFDKSLDRTVAIKVLSPHLASSGAARRRFSREAKAAAAVLHPNVIAIHGVCNDAALPYLVMPYIRGESLQRRVDVRGPLPLSEILRIGQQIAAGLSAAHTQGLVHRDIKPANILLEDGVERVTITDFGLARAVDDATMTRSGVIAGTPQYMSPEQARGDSIDARSDLFSLGSVLYAMCTGRSPFRAETCYGVLRRITDDDTREIRDVNPEIPAWLVVLICRLHTKQPTDRIQTASEVEQLLNQCIAHVKQPDKQSLPDGLRLREKRSNPSLAMLGVVLTVAVVVMALLSTWHGNGQNAKSVGPTQATIGPVNEQKTGDSQSQTAVSWAPETAWDDGVGESLRTIGQSLQDLDESTQKLMPKNEI